MKLKIFFDQEYFSFAREYISLYNFEDVFDFDNRQSLDSKDALSVISHDLIQEDPGLHALKLSTILS